jgi:hypothetical protein
MKANKIEPRSVELLNFRAQQNTQQSAELSPQQQPEILLHLQ